MLRKLLLLSAIVLYLATEQASAQMVLEVKVTGALSPADKQAAEMIIAAENRRRAALTPPGEPLVYTDAATRRAAYELALTEIIKSAHNSYITQASEISHADRKKAFEAAPSNVQDQINTLLQPYIPAPGAFMFPVPWRIDGDLWINSEDVYVNRINLDGNWQIESPLARPDDVEAIKIDSHGHLVRD